MSIYFLYVFGFVVNWVDVYVMFQINDLDSCFGIPNNHLKIKTNPYGLLNFSCENKNL